ncbi:hypothetical protein [Tengunoibacter tsumagoiensis]|uniref:Uncharacterized protein n=1 Tax=Tengunoibacter tsumagoiensis TaxID=2014871 RepID=A0A401ZWM5_9CHLR|nr:hypothetical protein [Tengunoibacter tsumagoiensis]GCE11134.1 hypothetical protein KTT_09930 [Tengunoibacter tsumagoiensis]
MEERTGRKWLWRILDFINPLRDPSLTVAAVLTFIEEAGQHDTWYWIIVIALVNWLAVRGVVWLIVNFAFAATFLGRRLWWAMKHPNLAWRILDAVGHEEIVIGGMPSINESIMLQDGTTIMTPMLGASGIHIIGELPAGTELPVLGLPGGQGAINGNGFFPGSTAFSANGFAGQSTMNYSQVGGNEYVSQQSTDGFPQQGFNQRPSQEEERLYQQVEAITRLMDDWIQFTEEKWRAVSDSQLGWKPLRGRWGGWDDIFQDVYAAKTSDPMAQAAQSAGEATARRFDTSKDKGSAASAVACFMRDMMTLRRGLDMIQQPADNGTETPHSQPVVQPSLTKRFGGNTSGNLFNGTPGAAPRSSLIRRPAQIFVDADSEK